MSDGKSAYSYTQSLKSPEADELINLVVIRPLAGLLVRVLYTSRVTPTHLTTASLCAGIVAAALLFFSESNSCRLILAGSCITIKDILDSADGQLARARKEYSRFGRFFDSFVDVVVNALVFAALGFIASASMEVLYSYVLACVAFLSTTLRVSYHVFYYVSFLHRRGTYENNRLNEESNSTDTSEDKATAFFHRFYLVVYGWQDRVMAAIDRRCAEGLSLTEDDISRRWYEDRFALFLSGFQGLGTELFLLMLCVVSNNVLFYLHFNVLVLNGLWILSIAYRRFILRFKILSAPMVLP